MTRKLSIDIDLQPLAPGLVGLVDGLAQIMHHVAASTGESLPLDAGGLDGLRDELICISGAAFAHYVFEPSFNQHEESPRRYSALSDLFCNYGPFESLGYYTGWQVQDVNGLSADDLWELVRFELGAGRPMLTVGARGPLQPAIITGYQEGPGRRVLELRRRDAGAVEEVEITHLKNLQDPEESFHNWTVFTRPGEPPEWAAPADRQRMGLMRWVLKHARNTKEFFHETRENYAPGLDAYPSLLTLLRGLADEPADEALALYVEEHVEMLRAGRGAAARVLPGWGRRLAELLDDEEVAEAIAEAAEAYGDEAEALSKTANGGLIDAVTAAFEAERRAISALERIEAQLPKAFGTI